MRSFSDVGVFGAFLAAKAREIEPAGRRGLEKAAKLIQADAKARISHYQAAVGPFRAWEPLSSATLEGFWHQFARFRVPGKVELGYAPPDNPLLREGHLRDSIGYHVKGWTAQIGSGEMIAVWQELGTPHAIYPIPPRPFLGPAGFAKREAVVKAIGKEITDTLAGRH